MSAKKLVVVESPAKAKTLSRYLGRDFVVKASVGHVVDLPKNKLGVDVEKDFEPHYEIIHGKGKVIAELKSALKGKEIIYLGPDAEREGEVGAAPLQPRERADGPLRVLHRGTGALEGPEVVRAHQAPGRLAHGIDIERRRNVPGVAPQERRLPLHEMCLGLC